MNIVNDSPWIDFTLYLITDRHQTAGRDLEYVVEEALRGGVRAVQLREKDLSSKELYEVATQLRRVTARHNAKLFINDRVDVALAVDADGVHLGNRSLPTYKVRRLLGEKRLIGVSCHNKVQALAAQEAGADFITFGPVYFTPSKSGMGEPLGVERLEAVTKLLRIPVFALGGVKRSNCAEIMAHGAHGVALISGIFSAPDPRQAACQLLTVLPAAEHNY